jgi:site-specific DNA-methyltransferase (adenine-specific)
MLKNRVEVIGDATLYLGDCLEILPTLPKVDAVITDPPYGIALDVSIYTTKSGIKHNRFSAVANDDKPPSEALSILFALDIPTVIFGSNNFPELLPHRGKTIVWDKRCTEAADGLRGSPVEIAWENRKNGYDRIIRVQHGGVINADSISGNSEQRFHPTQKPAQLMKKILAIKPYADCASILDPFMGSGTTGVACANLGRKFIGIEIEPKYFDIACERIDNAYRQKRMFP